MPTLPGAPGPLRIPRKYYEKSPTVGTALFSGAADLAGQIGAIAHKAQQIDDDNKAKLTISERKARLVGEFAALKVAKNPDTGSLLSPTELVQRGKEITLRERAFIKNLPETIQGPVLQGLVLSIGLFRSQVANYSNDRIVANAGKSLKEYLQGEVERASGVPIDAFPAHVANLERAIEDAIREGIVAPAKGQAMKVNLATKMVTTRAGGLVLSTPGEAVKALDFAEVIILAEREGQPLGPMGALNPVQRFFIDYLDLKQIGDLKQQAYNEIANNEARRKKLSTESEKLQKKALDAKTNLWQNKLLDANNFTLPSNERALASVVAKSYYKSLRLQWSPNQLASAVTFEDRLNQAGGRNAPGAMGFWLRQIVGVSRSSEDYVTREEFLERAVGEHRLSQKGIADILGLLSRRDAGLATADATNANKKITIAAKYIKGHVGFSTGGGLARLSRKEAAIRNARLENALERFYELMKRGSEFSGNPMRSAHLIVGQEKRAKRVRAETTVFPAFAHLPTGYVVYGEGDDEGTIWIDRDFMREQMAKLKIKISDLQAEKEATKDRIIMTQTADGWGEVKGLLPHEKRQLRALPLMIANLDVLNRQLYVLMGYHDVEFLSKKTAAGKGKKEGTK